jgi:hypothetical protein
MLDTTQDSTGASSQDTALPVDTMDEGRARIDAMTPMRFRTYTDRLRRMAYRQGLVLAKCRTRDPRALTYRGYTLTDLRTRKIVLGRRSDGYLPEIFEVEWYLTR